MSLHRKYLSIAIASLAVGCVIGVSFGSVLFKSKNTGQDRIVRVGGYTFINPILSCNISENKKFEEYRPINDKLKKYIEDHILSGDAKNISVYFRGLNSGNWSGVNEEDRYSPASLLKVPVLIAYLKETEVNPNKLKENVVYHEKIDENNAETFRPKSFIQNGHSYTIEELLKYLIMYSDNNAAQMLQDNIDPNSLSEVYSDLGIPVTTSLTEDSMTPKIYSYIFRILYNGTYLSKSMSEYALRLLASGDFNQGIKAGIPLELQTAHKFGERSVYVKDKVSGKLSLSYKELHDCGIIYYPNNPYILCVMTRGDDFSKLSSIISNISSLIYSETKSGVLKI